MKTRRHSKILELIQQHNIDTQEELLKLLRAEGYDSMQWDGVVATLAGDDTIFILVRNEAAAINLDTELKKIMKS